MALSKQTKGMRITQSTKKHKKAQKSTKKLTVGSGGVGILVFDHAQRLGLLPSTGLGGGEKQGRAAEEVRLGGEVRGVGMRTIFARRSRARSRRTLGGRVTCANRGVGKWGRRMRSKGGGG